MSCWINKKKGYNLSISSTGKLGATQPQENFDICTRSQSASSPLEVLILFVEHNHQLFFSCIQVIHKRFVSVKVDVMIDALLL